MEIRNTINMNQNIKDSLQNIISELQKSNIDESVSILNFVRKELHNVSPFKAEPVDYVEWVKTSQIVANDYNPNTVAPPEMELLKTSILEDGYTQPVVTFHEEDRVEVVDGFHRNRVAKECKEVNDRIHGYLPIVDINQERTDKGDRIASTIRHNRARGKHRVDAMSNIVLDLKRRNWSDKKIAKELGMDQDEVLRLTQITGLAEMFKNGEFSKAWDLNEIESSDINLDIPIEELEDDAIDG